MATVGGSEKADSRIREQLPNRWAGSSDRRNVEYLDAYANPGFQSRLSTVEMGYRTRTILCMPVHDRRKKIFAVAQLLNRKDGQPLPTKADEDRFRESEGATRHSARKLFSTDEPAGRCLIVKDLPACGQFLPGDAGPNSHASLCVNFGQRHQNCPVKAGRSFVAFSPEDP